MIKKLLAHPLTSGFNLDDPNTTELRHQIIQSKPFLKRIYMEWYTLIAGQIADLQGSIFELGSGAGFIKQLIPHAYASEIFYLPFIDIVLDGLELPLQTSSLAGLLMVDVFHHIPDSRGFLNEALRVLVIGGKLVMIEPWVSKWSKRIYQSFHHEPFYPQSKDWGFSSTGPLSGSNQALPWIVFERDKEKFEHEFSQLRILLIQPMMPFRYILSGGVSMRSFVPGWSYDFWRWLEGFFIKKMHQWGMFALIVLEKIR
ncbi:MAG TPA: class I SAM-dependent methyltransferase [Anaerolineae bacterium]|nr:class I SAM-dependent methyltransferase [Anaerolineae bacterium]